MLKRYKEHQHHVPTQVSNGRFFFCVSLPSPGPLLRCLWFLFLSPSPRSALKLFTFTVFSRLSFLMGKGATPSCHSESEAVLCKFLGPSHVPKLCSLIGVGTQTRTGGGIEMWWIRLTDCNTTWTNWTCKLRYGMNILQLLLNMSWGPSSLSRTLRTPWLILPASASVIRELEPDGHLQKQWDGFKSQDWSGQ